MIPTDSWSTTVVFTNTATLLCGGLITYLAFRAFERTRSPSLYSLALGLGLVTLGALAGGFSHQFTSLGFEASLAVQSSFSALGFVTMAFSLYAGHPDRSAPLVRLQRRRRS